MSLKKDLRVEPLEHRICLVFATMLNFSCSATLGDRRTLSMKLFGHRGCSASHAENTLSAVRKALMLADGAELDVIRTQDGTMVVLHDSTLARTAMPWPGRCQGNGAAPSTPQACRYSEVEYHRLVNTNVSELTYDEIKETRVGRPHVPYEVGVAPPDNELYGGEVLATLPAALEMLRAFPCKTLLVEVKGDDETAAALVARDVLKSGVAPEQVTLIGFSLPTMVAAKRLLPLHKACHIIEQRDVEHALEAVVEATRHGLDGIDFMAERATVTADVVVAAKLRGLQVLVWVHATRLPGSDVTEEWECLMRRGVDVFTSDLPEAAFSWLKDGITSF